MARFKYIFALTRFYYRPFLVIAVALASTLLVAVRTTISLAPETSLNLPKAVHNGVKAAHTIKSQSQSCRQKACIALTFDDGPNPKSTADIVKSLNDQQAKATFFLIGRYVKGHEDLVIEIAKNGNDIGNHSWSHPDFTKLSPVQISQQISSTQQAIADLGIQPPVLFRPPYGSFRTPQLKYIRLAVILWNVDPKDWAQKSPAAIVKAVDSEAKPGAIIVMHDQSLTAKALPEILRDLRAKYQFVTVSQLLNLGASPSGIYYSQ